MSVFVPKGDNGPHIHDMDIYLNAGFGDPLGDQTLRLIHSLGFAGIRQDLITDGHAFDLQHIRLLCGEIAQSSLGAILIVGCRGGGNIRGWDPVDVAEQAGTIAVVCKEMGLLDRREFCAIEIGNEPNTDLAGTSYQHDPARFAELVRRSRDAIRGAIPDAVPIISGGISNTHQNGLNYLREAMSAGIPLDIAVGYHSYRTTKPPESPNPGFKSRDEEFATLKEIAGPRDLYCTECGWHTAISKDNRFFWRKTQFTDEQVAEFVSREVVIHARHGAKIFTLFQLNDAEGDGYEAKFGIRRRNGDPKPVAMRIADLAQQVKTPTA